MTKMTIIRGLPGSGKSTYAKTLDAIHVEADMFYINQQGDYDWNAAFARDGHDWCRLTVEIFMCNGKDVVVSNTFTELWEMQPYIEFEIICMVASFGSIHNIPEGIIEKMRKRFVRVDGERIVT